MALGGDTGVPEFGIAASITLLIAVALGAYFLILGGQYGEKQRSGIGVLIGQALAYLVGVGVLLPGTAFTGSGVHDLLIYTFQRGRFNQFMGLFVMTLPLGALLACAGIAVLIAAGRYGTGEPQASREPPSGG